MGCFLYATLDWRLGLVSLIPFIFGISFTKSVMNEEYSKNYNESVVLGQKMNNALVEYIDVIEVMKAFNQSKLLIKNIVILSMTMHNKREL